MNRYLISAAALALLAAPAFAQPDNHDHGDGHPGGGGGHERPAGGGAAPAARPAAPAAPAAAPQAGRPDRGGNAGANTVRGGNAGANTGNGRLDATAVNRALVGDRAPQQGNRGPDNNRGTDNRGPGNGGNFGPGNRPGNGGARPGNAPRPDFSHFNDFHRNFRAQNRFHAPAYNRPSGFSYRRWNYGEFLPALFWNQQYWLSDYGSYDLPPPPPGTTWVRYGNDALLIDRYSGEIVTVEYSVFY
jgi:Ni/Co efflux regulator RcnB